MPARTLFRHDPELGPVRLCRGCAEEWPVDEAFWFFSGGKVMGRCRACWSERVRVEGRKVFRARLPEWHETVEQVQ